MLRETFSASEYSARCFAENAVSGPPPRFYAFLEGTMIARLKDKPVAMYFARRSPYCQSDSRACRLLPVSFRLISSIPGEA
jgi:hypothetical protein